MTKRVTNLFKNDGKNFWQVTGPVDFNMTNDYMFKATLQECPLALKGLISALLRVDPESIEAEITNPIELGKSIINKDFYLDAKVIINNKRCINLEMQIENLGNWPERALSYTARAYDSLQKGDLYTDVMPMHHIGFVCFNIFENHNILYDTFSLKNNDGTLIFSDKFMLSVVNLKQIDKASDEDVQYNLDKWCRFITAQSWEELQILAKEDSYMEATANTLYMFNSDFDARENAIRRKEYYDAIAYRDRKMDEMDVIIAKQDVAIAEKDATIADKDATIAEQDAAIADKDATIADMDATIADMDATIAKLKKQLAKYENS